MCNRTRKQIRFLGAALAALLLPGLVACARADKTDGSSTVAPETTAATSLTPQPTAAELAQTTAAQTTVPETAAAAAEQTTAAPAPVTTTAAAPAPTEAQTPAVPATKAEIVSFFSAAVNDVKNNGSASYDKVEYQKIHAVNMTGNATVDRMISESIGSFAKDESTAQHVKAEKGTPASGDNMLGWDLSDDGAVVSATLTEEGGVYHVTILMADEDTPSKTDPKHLEAVGSVIYPEEIETALASVPQMNGFGDIRIVYTGYTITADVTPEGKLVSLRHQANVEIRIGYMKIVVFSLDNKSITLENIVEYSGFSY